MKKILIWVIAFFWFWVLQTWAELIPINQWTLVWRSYYTATSYAPSVWNKVITYSGSTYSFWYSVTNNELIIQKNTDNPITIYSQGSIWNPIPNGNDNLSILVINNYAVVYSYFWYYSWGYTRYPKHIWYLNLDSMVWTDIWEYKYIQWFYIQNDSTNCIRLADMTAQTCPALTQGQKNNSKWTTNRVIYQYNLYWKSLIFSFGSSSWYSGDTPVTIDTFNATAKLRSHSTIPSSYILNWQTKTTTYYNIREFYDNKIDGNVIRWFCVDFGSLRCFSVQAEMSGDVIYTTYWSYLDEQINNGQIPIGVRNNSTLLTNYNDLSNFKTADRMFGFIWPTSDNNVIYLDNYLINLNNPLIEWNEWTSGGNESILCDVGTTKNVTYSGSVYNPLIWANYNCVAHTDNQTLLDCEFDLLNSRNQALVGTGIINNVYTTDYDINNLISISWSWSFVLSWINDSDATNINLPSWINVARVSQIWSTSTNSAVYRVWTYYKVNYINNTKVAYGNFYDSWARYVTSYQFYNTSQEEMSQGFKYLFYNEIWPLRNKVVYNIALIWYTGEWIFSKTCCTSGGKTYCDWVQVQCSIWDETCIGEKLRVKDDTENRNLLNEWKTKLWTPPTTSGSVLEPCQGYAYNSEAYRQCVNLQIWIPTDQWGFEWLNKVIPTQQEQKKLFGSWRIVENYVDADEFAKWLWNQTGLKDVLDKAMPLFILIVTIIVVLVIFRPRRSKD